MLPDYQPMPWPTGIKENILQNKTRKIQRFWVKKPGHSEKYFCQKMVYLNTYIIARGQGTSRSRGCPSGSSFQKLLSQKPVVGDMVMCGGLLGRIGLNQNDARLSYHTLSLRYNPITSQRSAGPLARLD